MRFRMLAVVVFLGAVPGCIDEEGNLPTGTGAADQLGPEAFEQLNLLTDSPLTLAPCTEVWREHSWAAGAQCAVAEHPIRFDDTRINRTISLGVARIPASSGVARAHLWLLTGGPGGASIDTFAQGFLDAPPDVDLWFVDTRGVGHSSRLTCSAEDVNTELGAEISSAELGPCLDELSRGHDLAAYGTTQSAYDLGVLMLRARATVGSPNMPIGVYGTSYGTLLAQRTMMLFPDLVRRAVLQGVVPSGTLMLPDGGFDASSEALHESLAICLATPNCHFEMGSPQASLADIERDLIDGVAGVRSCYAASVSGLSPYEASLAIGRAVDGFPTSGPDSFPLAEAWRLLNQCPEDPIAAGQFAEWANHPGLESRTNAMSGSRALSLMILASELGRPFDNSYFGPFGVSPSYLNYFPAADLAIATRYPRSWFDQQPFRAPRQTAIQVWNGRLDSRTSFSGAQQFASAIGAQFVPVQEGAHYLYGNNCYRENVMAFLSETPSDPFACAQSIELPF